MWARATSHGRSWPTRRATCSACWSLGRSTGTPGRSPRLCSAKGVGPYLEFLRTPGVTTWWNRVHLDVAPYPGDDQEAEVARLRALGAADADVGQGDVPRS